MQRTPISLNLHVKQITLKHKDLDFSKTLFRKSQRPEGGSEKKCSLNFVR